MLRRAIISPLNPIQFIPSGVTKADRYNNPVPYYSWGVEQLRTWETDRQYMQPIQASDPLNLQIKFSKNNLYSVPAAILYLYPCDGEEINHYAFSEIVGYPVSIEDNLTMIGQQYNDATFFKTLFEDFGPGQYYFVIRFSFRTGPGTTESDDWISERFELRESWPDTVLLEYTNDTNTADVIFEQIKQSFAFRIPAALINPKDLVNRVTFMDQNAKQVPLSADPYTGYTFAIGGNGQFVADWAFKKLNWIFALDHIQSDGFGITPADNAALVRDYFADYPLFSGKIDVLESRPERDYRFNRGSLILFNAPVSLFVVMKLQIGNNGIAFYEDLIPHIITGSPALDAYVTALNLALGLAGFTGTVIRTGQEISYTIGDNEDYNFADAVLLNKSFGIRSVVSGIVPVLVDLGLQSFDGANAPYLIGNPNGSINTYGYLDDGLQTFNLSANSQSSGSNFYTVYHNDLIGGISIDGPKVASFTGTTEFPVQLRIFTLSNAGVIDTFNMDMLSESKSYLEALLITACPLLTTFSGYAASMGTPWFRLKLLFCTNSHLSVSSVDSFLGEIETRIGAGLQVAFNGGLNLSGQTPPAPPTSGAPTLTIGTLENNYNWTVTTD